MLTKEEKVRLLHLEAGNLLEASLMIDEGIWHTARFEVAAIAERLLQYVRETEVESRETHTRTISSAAETV